MNSPLMYLLQFNNLPIQLKKTSLVKQLKVLLKEYNFYLLDCKLALNRCNSMIFIILTSNF